MKGLAIASLILIATGKPAVGAELRTCTLEAWDAHVQAARSRMEDRLGHARPFLWAQESEQRMRFMRGGGILVEPMGSNGRIVVAGGLIHHWIGAVFVPGVTASQVLAKLDDYEKYQNFYKPSVIEARVLARNGDKCRFSMRWTKRVSLATSVIDADYESICFRSRLDRWWSVSRSTRIQEVEHCGRADERLQPIGIGSGYIWRLYSITRVMEVDRGAVIEVEAMVLSRDIPPAVAWLVNPIVNRTSRNTLLTTLTQTREAVLR